MGIFNMFKNKVDRLDRSKVVESICELNREYDLKQKEIDRISSDINDLMQKGKASKDMHEQRNIATKIKNLKHSKEALLTRQNYLEKLVAQQSRLKVAMDDKEFFDSLSDREVSKVMQDPVALEKYLNKVYANRTKVDDSIEVTDDVFDTVESGYEESESVYGMDEETSSIMAMFEESNSDVDFDKDVKRYAAETSDTTLTSKLQDKDEEK